MQNSFAMPLGNNLAPAFDAGGPKGVFYSMVLAANQVPLEFDLQSELMEGEIEFIQGVWIDNSLNATGCRLTIQGSGQIISVKANTQGVYPIFSAPANFKASCIASTAAAITIPIILLNVPMPHFVYSTV